VIYGWFVEKYVLQILPTHLGLTVELALPGQGRERGSTRRLADLNESVDCVLRTIRAQTSPALGGTSARRRIAFSSFSPQACVALNWKQPNCQSSPLRIVDLLIFA